MKYYTLLLFAGFLVFSACKKDETDQWFNYAQTYCADPWDQQDSLGSSALILEVRATDYLSTTAGVTVYDFEFMENFAPAENCEACSCKTGNLIKIKTEKADAATLESLGFYQ